MRMEHIGKRREACAHTCTCMCMVFACVFACACRVSRVACHGSRVAACAIAEALSRAPCASLCVLCSERLTDWPLEEVIGGTIGPQRAVVVHGAWSRAQADGS